MWTSTSGDVIRDVHITAHPLSKSQIKGIMEDPEFEQWIRLLAQEPKPTLQEFYKKDDY